MEKKRCNFSFDTKEYHISEKFLLYHDTRWCKPEHREQELYAMLVLEGMQAGVSWNLILNKEDNFTSEKPLMSLTHILWQIMMSKKSRSCCKIKALFVIKIK